MAAYRSPILVALAAFAATAFGQASLKCQVQPRTLAAMRHCYRPLLVFSPSATDTRLKRQSEILDADADDMMDRFVLFTPVLPSSKGYSAPLDTPYILLSAQQMQAIRSRVPCASGDLCCRSARRRRQRGPAQHATRRFHSPQLTHRHHAHPQNGNATSPRQLIIVHISTQSPHRLPSEGEARL